MEQKLYDELVKVVFEQLIKAEKFWSDTMEKQASAQAKNEVITTNIPGFRKLTPRKAERGEFIAMTLDMRDSHAHLTGKDVTPYGLVEKMQRVYYEVTGLLNCMATIVEKDREGSVLEYLGDGFLAIFKLPENIDSRNAEIMEVGKITKNCMEALDQIVNPILWDRYQLSPLQMGIGLSQSEAMVQLFGINENLQPKVIGDCVYTSAKLSKGRNTVQLDHNLMSAWPTAPYGQIVFQPDIVDGNLAYNLTRTGA